MPSHGGREAVVSRIHRGRRHHAPPAHLPLPSHGERGWLSSGGSSRSRSACAVLIAADDRRARWFSVTAAAAIANGERETRGICRLSFAHIVARLSQPATERADTGGLERKNCREDRYRQRRHHACRAGNGPAREMPAQIALRVALGESPTTTFSRRALPVIRSLLPVRFLHCISPLSPPHRLSFSGILLTAVPTSICPF
ncbi:hypothetical protein MRX96_015825 [Rhipicephalus microplus]